MPTTRSCTPSCKRASPATREWKTRSGGPLKRSCGRSDLLEAERTDQRQRDG